MKLSIIVVNFRSWRFLQKALHTLEPDFPEDWEVIVIDNESEAEPFYEFEARYPWITFVANPHNSGFGFGCNLDALTGSDACLPLTIDNINGNCIRTFNTNCIRQWK